jgi:hypothetical protein
MLEIETKPSRFLFKKKSSVSSRDAKYFYIP